MHTLLFFVNFCQICTKKILYMNWYKSKINFVKFIRPGRLLKVFIMALMLLSFSESLSNLELDSQTKKKTLVIDQEIKTWEWTKFNSRVDFIELEFLSGQTRAYVQTEHTKLPLVMHSEVQTNEGRNISDLEKVDSSQWFKVESDWGVRLLGWNEYDNKDILYPLREMVASIESKLIWIKIISRSNWWADESLRYDYAEWAKGWADQVNVMTTYDWDDCGSFISSYPNEYIYSRIKYSDSNWMPLLWPFQYSPSIKKIIVHHTAESDKSADLPWAEKMKSIYRFHTLTRGWGDVGYNYVIDGDWFIYEGRAWWDYVVWWHAYCNNIWTVWISLMWNFQNIKPTLPQLTSLSNLVWYLWKKYSVDVSWNSTFHWALSPNLLWHRDVRHTACPWDNLYTKLPNVAKQIALSWYNFDIENVLLKKDAWDAKVASEVNVIEMQPTTTKTITFTYRNTGKESWKKWTWLYVADNNNKSLYVSSIFADKDYVAADMIENEVKPQELAHFEVEIVSGYSPWVYSLEFTPIINWTKKLVAWTIVQPVKVLSSNNSYEFIELTPPPSQVYYWQSFTAQMKLENTWNTTWYRSWDNSINLRSYPIWSESVFVPEWKDYDKKIIARLIQPKVDPWEFGTFEFVLKAPLKPWSFEEKFIPVIWQNIILGDRSMQFNIKVKTPNYRAQILKETSNFEYFVWEKKTIRLWLKNLSDVDWEADQVEFKVVDSWGFKFDSSSYTINSFVPTMQAWFANITIQAPERIWQYSIVLQALANGKKFDKLWRFELDINVVRPDLSWYVTYLSNKNLNIEVWKLEIVTVRIKNRTNITWQKNWINKIYLRSLSEKSSLSNSKWISSNTVSYMEEAKVFPWNTATFQIPIIMNQSWNYSENFFARINSMGNIKWTDFDIKVNVSSWKQKLKDVVAVNTTQAKNNEYNSNDTIKIKLSFPEKAVNVWAKGDMKLYLDWKQLWAKSSSNVWARSDWKSLIVVNIDWVITTWKRFVASAWDNSFITLKNWYRPSWDKSINDNFFRWNIIITQNNWVIEVINQLNIENYLKWIWEVPEDAHQEKRKALVVIARSYALHYMKSKYRKFPWKEYDWSDSPNEFQKYLWAGFELRSPKWQQAIRDTQRERVTYNWEVLRAAYFSCSNWRTRTPKEANWTQDYFNSVADVYKSVNDEFWVDMVRYNKGQCGHWVWLSWLWAENLAQRWNGYKMILYYYYQGINIEKY